MGLIMASCLLISCSSVRTRLAVAKFKNNVVDFWTGGKVKENGVVWKRGAYFPEYVSRYFPRSRDFIKKHPKRKLARRGVKLIEVKMLNPLKSKFHEANLSWSKDGAYLSYEVLTEKSRKIYVKNLVGGFSKEIYVIPRKKSDDIFSELFEPPVSYNAYLRWGKDSKRFAFMSNGGTGDYNIYIGGLNDEERKITRHESKDGYADWSQESDGIVFVSGRTGNGDLYLTDSKGKYEKRLTLNDANDLFPQWSPEGDLIVYSSGKSNNHDIFMLFRDTDYNRSVKLASLPSDDLRPVFSPDGTKIAFYANQGMGPASRLKKQWSIWVFDISNILWDEELPDNLELEPIEIVNDAVLDLNTGPAWTPDSKKIVYVELNSDKFNPIQVVNLETGVKTRLLTKTKMNHDVMCANSGIISFRAQVDSWDKVFVALTNQSIMLQSD